jgi:HD-GYP domain-containing protein (c-di-GMP phosphodiesterase class II)
MAAIPDREGIVSTETNGPYAELLCALSFSSDLNMGQTMEHGLKTVWIAMQLAEEMGLSAEDRVSTYYGGMLKDAG